jgi:hypothetical protein
MGQRSRKQPYLNFWVDRYDRNHKAKNQVNTDEELVFCAAIWFGVEFVQQSHGNDCDGIKEACNRE